MLKELVTVGLVLTALVAGPSAAAGVVKRAIECPEKFDVVGEYCLHVSADYLEDSIARTWLDAREKCQGLAPEGWTSDFVVLSDANKLALLSKHIYKNHETLRGLIWWVGARQIFGHGALWVWLDGTNVDTYSNLWLPNQPPLETTFNTTVLVPAGSEHFRLYMDSRPNHSMAPSFVCEAARA